MEFPTRKTNRLKDFDYSSPGAYFITICTKDRKNIFWTTTEPCAFSEYELPLSEPGKIVESCIHEIPVRYPALFVDKYTIMPNHIHLLLRIKSGANGRPLAAPTIPNLVNQFKGAVSKKIGFSPWQKGYHDHVVRNREDFEEIWTYIHNNSTQLMFHTFPFFRKD